MIVNSWDTAFTAQYGHEFPDTYLCFDTEFTGSNADSDLILEIGHTMVERGQIVDQGNYVLNWYNHPDIKEDWLNYKLNAMRSVVGPKWRLMPELIHNEGQDPLTILRFYHKLFSTWRKRNLCFVAQNGQHADERMLKGNFFRYLKKDFDLPSDRYFDTGAIFKATQVWTSEQTQNFRLAVLPARSDTLKAYFQRVIGLRLAGIKWSLPVILEHYDIINKQNLDMSQHHNAGFDSMCLHWIMETYGNEVVKHPPKIGTAEKVIDKTSDTKPIMRRSRQRVI